MLTTKVAALNSYSCFEDIISISLLFRRHIFRFAATAPHPRYGWKTCNGLFLSWTVSSQTSSCRINQITGFVASVLLLLSCLV